MRAKKFRVWRFNHLEVENIVDPRGSAIVAVSRARLLKKRRKTVKPRVG